MMGSAHTIHALGLPSQKAGIVLMATTTYVCAMAGLHLNEYEYEYYLLSSVKIMLLLIDCCVLCFVFTK